MKKLFIIFIFLSLFFFLDVKETKAKQSVGFLDAANESYIAGWAKDDDYNGPIQVHIYVDGQIAQGVTADVLREPAVGSHGFYWSHPSFGPGNHRVNAYAIGVDSTGQPDNNNPELIASPKTITAQEEYPLTSSDGNVTAVVNAKFGGSITKILDNINWPGKNIIVDWHGGALMQSAFWLPEKANTFPEGCDITEDEGYKFINPTQGGYYADVVAGTKYGNPIGLQGNDTRYLDPNEFIRYENNGKTVHLKSKFIRHDYCKDPRALIENKSLWDTNFYIEQWISFYPDLPRTLKLRSIISYVGDEPRTISVRQLPVAFFQDVTRVAYWKNGQKVIETPSGALPFDPDQAFAAFLLQGTDAGMGVVAAPTLRGDSIPGRGQKFSFGMQNPVSNITIFDIGYGVPTFTSFGKANGLYNQTAHLWTFDPGGMFEWYTYYPIGALDMIKQNAEALLTDYSAFGMSPPTPTPTPTPGDISGLSGYPDGVVDIHDYNLLIGDFNQTNSPADIDGNGIVDIYDYNSLITNFGRHN